MADTAGRLPNLAPDLQHLLGRHATQALTVLLASLSRQPLGVWLVGGVVRDQWLHHHRAGAGGQGGRVQPMDVDLLLTPDPQAPELTLRQLAPRWETALAAAGWSLSAQVHGDFGTAQLTLEPAQARQPPHPTDRKLLTVDVAMARTEHYPAPGENPRVTLTASPDAVLVDLGRRDVSINAMALPWPHGPLLDPHGGQSDLERGLLRFLHHTSLRDDPTRVIRAARYGARLHMDLDPEARRQLQDTMARWPWRREPPCPPALGSRLGMELALLLQQEPWRQGLSLLQDWGALDLVDWSGSLQQDPTWRRRLHWATRWNLPLLPALLMGAADPLAVAQRLQLPTAQQRLMAQTLALRDWLG
ncbi:CCA tRNA nucleotidyltransferase [Candidatus Synechococcus spongiarum]|uniref:tRNA nucleotidyltransferase, A-adding n=1 Tax=Candidatus Synechococcus spongiarum TaxID=431041 RepID=A0A165B3S1_9SYNE|nr:CCA tRNA nucleotidyltransferase [Candidatus Synechococcus spongiarum]SAY40033.1 tRNA nucleotidyltransferase, A-adding (EC 2.7.7.25) [Candidatus Synechococcus spongiarum]